MNLEGKIIRGESASYRRGRQTPITSYLTWPCLTPAKLGTDPNRWAAHSPTQKSSSKVTIEFWSLQAAHYVDLDSRTLVTNNSQQPRSFISSNDNRQTLRCLVDRFLSLSLAYSQRWHDALSASSGWRHSVRASDERPSVAHSHRHPASHSYSRLTTWRIGVAASCRLTDSVWPLKSYAVFDLLPIGSFQQDARQRN